MLKALELFGFKSFADKTRFEFPPGITVVVGPNGSGKSNVVDAIKWVLGEQSAKSLRGKDMSDVIFKGAGDGARKLMNAAEATIVFDNSDNRLPLDAPEVHVTRRVYRSGEGEYLINRQPCRLKDIRDLFRGTGVGADAYSLIEQGKVDQLLQASSRDRRAIFEEAAGISRFKAKKIETQRRLERVDQNLLRLRDIVDEVENQLKSIRAQASKARRFREYSQRLQDLRTQVGMTDWRRLSRELAAHEAELVAFTEQSCNFAAKFESAEARVLEVDFAITSSNETIHNSENQLARVREQIGSRQAASDFARSRLRELDEEMVRYRSLLLALSGRGDRLQENLKGVADSLLEAEQSHYAVAARARSLEGGLKDLTQQLTTQRSEAESARQQHLQVTRSAASLTSQLHVSQQQMETLTAEHERAGQRIESFTGALARSAIELNESQMAERHVEEQSFVQAAAILEIENALIDRRNRLREKQDELSQLQERLSGTRGRAALLDELEAKFEGLASGVREVLEQCRNHTAPEFAGVRGLVAEMLQANFEMAPLIDSALGEVAQYLILTDERLLDALRDGRFRPSGRIGLIKAAEVAAVRSDSAVDLSHESGVIGRADRCVETTPEWQPLAERLLRDTWLVDTLEDALRLRDGTKLSTRLVTRAGEVVETNGAIVAGQTQGIAGLVSRRSELRALKQEMLKLASQAEHLITELVAAQESVSGHEVQLRRATEDSRKLASLLAEHRMRTTSTRERFERQDRERHALEQELAQSRLNYAQVTRDHQDIQSQLTEVDEQVRRLEQRIRDCEASCLQFETRRQDQFRDVTAAKVELATSEQHVHGFRLQIARFEDDQRERSRSLSEAHDRLKRCLARRLQTEDEILTATSELSVAYMRKDQLLAQIGQEMQRREAFILEKAQVADAAQALRKEVQTLATRIHQIELAAGESRLNRKMLADRLREDYGIEFDSKNSVAAAAETLVREDVEQEIESLRRRLNSIGAVNLESLNELDELEARFNSLSGQYNDLAQAKETLERIIGKINTDSRRLFLETLEAIRINFQNLYRRAFGGGKADIVLEEGVDVLEAGVEILATPPGKPSFSNTLLSGGEKALTAVALLLAIFEYRPSPFCVLDEVDAPFDEANIGRFIDVLRGFLDRTRFVIVTHSKKTMTAATTLYGVTMQESGVSKRVSVRFDDVSEDGRISKDAMDREHPSDDERGAA